ncbi:hypothetical protein, partial [Gluconobacter kondonii]|uniref:hypothetical protein n=1 Tax=Gluconobacter kondonii TaxID=941463 RepID=UPI001B8AB9F4
IRLQNLDFRARKIHHQSIPSNPGTKHLGTQGLSKSVGIMQQKNDFNPMPHSFRLSDHFRSVEEGAL